MGSKLSSLSCTSCKGGQYDGRRYHGSKYKGRHSRQKHRRTLSNRRCRFDESIYEATAAPTVYMNRMDRRNKIKSDQISHPASADLTNLSNAGQPAMAQTSRPSVRSTFTVQSNALENVQENGDLRRCGETLCKEGLSKVEGSKNVGSSIEILECPDMSTISMRTPRNSMTPRNGTVISDAVCTPVESNHIDDTIFESRVSQCDITATTLTVPPNSLNSQFISGITPLESIREDEFKQDSSSDSVFAQSTKFFPDKYFPSQVQGPPPPSLLLNNNTLFCLSRGDSAEKSRQDLNATSLQADTSDGPGFDSDFGASAGVEMRIVSSDYSTPQQKPSTVKRWKVTKSGSKKRRFLRKEFFETNCHEGIGTSANNSISRYLQLHGGGRPSSDLQLPRPTHRRATISGSEASVAHVTMEWDPYDTAYGSAHWMEYIIPGITYPSHPLLCNEQYWL